jgi:VIT1/CCC1 family predicted Fe2+/Mn2+ transporter
MANQELINNWREEKRSAYLYTMMAAHEKNLLHKQLFLDLKKAAEKQALLWEEKIIAANLVVPKFTPSLKTRLLCQLIRALGIERLRFFLSAMKIRGMSIFGNYHTHLEHKHTSLNTASNLRAAVFGINDGLVSNMSLILGIAGANLNQHYIVLTGIAGLLAGACSMGAGEYISVRSQREVLEYQIAIEKQELDEYPEEEMEELSLIYQARGFSVEEADQLSRLIINNPNTALSSLARDELGLNPEEMVSPIGAMLASFFSFSIGAFIPLVPFLFGNYSSNLFISIIFTSITLFLIGGLLSLLTNRHPLLSGLRMFLIGASAGAITFIIGKWLGTSTWT